MKSLYLAMILVLSSGYAFAQDVTQLTVVTDKASYITGDTIKIDGTISSPGASNSAILQLYDPHNILIQIATITISSDEKFSTTIKAEGPSWQNDGTYLIKVIYVSPPINAVAQKSIDFKVQSQPVQSVTPNSTTKQSIPSQNYTTITENQNQSSFEQQIQQRIQSAKKMREALNNSSMPENQNPTIPFWVKDTARKWHDGTADNESFGKAIQYMVSAGLVTPKYAVTPFDTFDHIPSWVKNIAQWWTEGLVPDNTFFDSIQYLLDEKIIRN